MKKDNILLELIEASEQLLSRLDYHGSIDPIREEGAICDLREAILNAKKIK